MSEKATERPLNRPLTQMTLETCDGDFELSLQPMTVVVGPNNSGKSTLLREVQQLLTHNRKARMLVNSTEFWTDVPLSALKEMKLVGLLDYFGNRYSTAEGQVIADLNRPDTNESVLGSQNQALVGRYLAMTMGELYGTSRLNVVRDKPRLKTTSGKSNAFMALFKSASLRKEWRHTVAEALGWYPVLEQGDGKLAIRLSSEPPETDFEELADWTRETQLFHRNARPISGTGDGLKCFVGILTEVISKLHSFIVIDEPEAFLHPPIARFLGRKLTELAVERGPQCIVATHSDDFLAGCLQAHEGQHVSIIRLERSEGKVNAHSLTPQDIRQIMEDPLLRASGALEGLFHRGVVVCEGDSDQVAYRFFHDRLPSDSQARDILWINAHSKSSVHRIVATLRKAGVPTAAIVDLDFLKEKNDLKNIFEAVGQAQAFQNFSQLRATVASELAGQSPAEWEHVSSITEAETLIRLLADNGVFVVKLGVLESWHRGFQKHEWVARALAHAMSGHRLDSADELDEFLCRVAKWLGDPGRQGM